MLAAISRAKDEVVDAKRYAELAEIMKQAGEAGKRRNAPPKWRWSTTRYEKLKREAHCVDFGDLVSAACAAS